MPAASDFSGPHHTQYIYWHLVYALKFTLCLYISGLPDAVIVGPENAIAPNLQEVSHVHDQCSRHWITPHPLVNLQHVLPQRSLLRCSSLWSRSHVGQFARLLPEL